MSNLNEQVNSYLEYCQYQKRLDDKSLKAYRIDLKQFSEQFITAEVLDITSEMLEKYIILVEYFVLK